MFLELPLAYWISKTFIPVGSIYHLLILWQELPHAPAHLSEERVESNLDYTGFKTYNFTLEAQEKSCSYLGSMSWYGFLTP